MLKTENRTIDGLEFTTTQLPAMTAFGLIPRLGRVVAPTLTKLTTMNGADDVGPALAELFSKLDPDEAQALTRDLLRATSVKINGKVVPLDRDETINIAFGGRLTLLLKAVWFAVQVNFADFLEAASVGGSSTKTPESETATAA